MKLFFIFLIVLFPIAGFVQEEKDSGDVERTVILEEKRAVCSLFKEYEREVKKCIDGAYCGPQGVPTNLGIYHGASEYVSETVQAFFVDLLISCDKNPDKSNKNPDKQVIDTQCVWEKATSAKEEHCLKAQHSITTQGS